ncbi:Hypothetical protein CINCED_3A003546 [Cinara cedri]|nr:Hypothetical protein CINCED_3A003546 [Cinara cedri]
MEMENLTSLEINGISKERIEMSLFDNLTSLQFLYLKEFHYCALYAKHVPVCLPNKDGLSSSLNLLPNRFIRWICWTVTGFTFVMNALVLCGRMFCSLRDENPAINFVIRNLAVADMCMVIYLTVVGYRDREYENNYYAHAHDWESSRLCTVIGIMAVISSEVSMLILMFISLERFLLIAVPLSGYRVLKLKTAVRCMASIWLVGITISIAPLVLWKHSSKFYGSNGFCYPLYIEDPFVDGWQYSAFMFLGLHVFSLLLMSILYALMYISVRKTRQAARISAEDYDFAIRFFFIVLANSFCWLPVIVLKIAALKKFHISSSTYGWVIIFIVPINAWVNPLLYTFTTPKYRKIITLKSMFKTHHESRKTIKRYSINETPHSSNVVPSKKTPSYPNNSPRKPQEKTQNEKTTTVDPLPTYHQINNNNANSTRENSFETTVAE